MPSVSVCFECVRFCTCIEGHIGQIFGPVLDSLTYSSMFSYCSSINTVNQNVEKNEAISLQSSGTFCCLNKM